MRSNLIPITRIYDIYPKYTYSNDVKKFMDEIVDIDRVNAFTKVDMVDVLDKIRAEIEHLTYYWCEVNPRSVIDDVLQIIDKYSEEQTE